MSDTPSLPAGEGDRWLIRTSRLGAIISDRRRTQIPALQNSRPLVPGMFALEVDHGRSRPSRCGAEGVIRIWLGPSRPARSCRETSFGIRARSIEALLAGFRGAAPFSSIAGPRVA